MMKTKTTRRIRTLPKSFDGLVKMMAPMAIVDDIHLATTLEVIDRLMQIDDLAPGQASYLETLVELAEVYEAKHHAIDVSDISGLDSLKYVVENANLSASDLARLLGIHPTMGSKILNGDRKLTWELLAALLTPISPAFAVSLAPGQSGTVDFAQSPDLGTTLAQTSYQTTPSVMPAPPKPSTPESRAAPTAPSPSGTPPR